MSTTVTSEAYVLVTIPNATLTSPSSGTLTGRLALEYITFSIPTTAARDVLLVLRLGDDPDGVSGFEAPLDPARTLMATVLPSGARRYIFHATQDDAEFALTLPAPPEAAKKDVELFHSVLAGYATDVRGGGNATAEVAPGAAQSRASWGPEGEDLRGRFVLVNEEGGEIVGALDESVRVREDPSLAEKGHENDPVVVEVPEDVDDPLEGLRNVEVLVRTVPPEERDWMMKSALFARHVSFLFSPISRRADYRGPAMSSLAPPPFSQAQ
jgi:spartin